MDTTMIADKREELKKAMEELCQAAAEDQELCDQIQKRNFWQRLFANNTRDLAKVGIKQIELLGNVQRAVQTLMEVIKDADERERQFVLIIDELRESVDKPVSELTKSVCKTIQAVVKSDRKIQRLEIKVAANEGINASKTAAQACVTFIEEYYKKATSIDKEEFCKVLAETISAKFIKKGVALRNEDKVFLIHALRGVSNPDWELMIERELEKIVPEGDRYSLLRNELVDIIDEFVKHREEVDPRGKSIQRLENAKKQLLESQFEIALIGEFQGGKSTTFNALCGGREISPRGLGTGGIKTSAAVITAQNISNDETCNGLKEWAEISWLSKETLRYRVAYALHLEEKNPLPSVAELEDAVKKAWSELNIDDDDSRDMLQIATLQLRLLKSPKYNSFMARKIVGIDEFQQYVKFPNDWEVRWCEQKMNADFSLEECLFTALDSVLVRIHSEYLQRLGCRITDCPGLFVSKWDTERALEIMSRSNAVMYLINGATEIGKAQKATLRAIRQGGWHTKCFFTLNERGNKISSDQIFRANKAKIQSAGINVENRIFRYNAAIAFRVAQLECVAKGNFGKCDIDCLARESVTNKVPYKELLSQLTGGDDSCRIKAIRSLIYNVLIPTGNFDPSYPQMPDTEFIANLKGIAGLNDIVPCLERHIVEHGAASILLGDGGSGAELCKQVLEILRGDKKAEEIAAQKDYETARKRWDEDERKFLKFKKSIEREFCFLQENTQLDNKFTEDFYNKKRDEIHANADEKLVDILKEEDKIFYAKTSSLKESISRKMQEAFSGIFKIALANYGEKIKDTCLYQTEIGNRIADSWTDLREEWDELEQDNPIFEGLCPTDEDVEIFITPFNNSIDQNIDVPIPFFEWFRNAFDAVLSWFGAERENSQQHLIKVVREKDPIRHALEELENSNKESCKLYEFFSQVRIQNKEKIDLSIKTSEGKFHERLEAEKKVVAESETIRQQKAQEAKRVREEIIEPWITKLAEFIAKVKSAY